MRYLVVLIACLLTGCFESRSNAQTQSVETRQGIEGGNPVNVVIRRQEVAQSESTAGVDVQAAITAAVSGLRGDVLGAIDKLHAKASEPKESPFPTAELATGAAGAVAALMAFLKHKEAAAAKRDADEAWDKHTKAVAKLPPEEAEKIL